MHVAISLFRNAVIVGGLGYFSLKLGAVLWQSHALSILKKQTNNNIPSRLSILKVPTFFSWCLHQLNFKVCNEQI